VQQALTRWLSDQITVQQVIVPTPIAGQEDQITIQINYTLIETQSKQQITILVS